MRSIQSTKRGPAIALRALLPGLGIKLIKIKVARILIYGQGTLGAYLILAGCIEMTVLESADEIEQRLKMILPGRRDSAS